MRVSPSFPVLVVALAVAAPAFAHEPPAAGARHPLLSWRPVAWRPAPAAPAIAAGLRVGVDPATGELTAPDAAAFPAAGAIGRAREAGLAVVTRPDGSRRVVVGDRLRRWSVVSTGADGALRQECVTSEAAAIARAQAAAATPAGGR